MNLSDNLKKIRREHNLSQEDLAEKLGVSRQSVSKWESNQAYPEMDKMIQICKMFDINIDELLNQDISEKQDKEIRKSKFNKQVESFLDFITKTVNMFSAMRFRDILKCLFEQIVSVIIALIIYKIISIVCWNIFGFINFIPQVIITILRSLFSICYAVFAFIILLHIFKIRYLDYYKIVDKSDLNIESKSEETNKEKDKIFYEKEKIIIRDPEKSSMKFFSFLASSIVILFKTIVALFSLNFAISFICIVVCLILSLLFIKTGFLFIGALIGGLGLLGLNALILIVVYNYIFNGKYKWNVYLKCIISFLIMCGVGIGLVLIGVKDFNIVDYKNENYYEKEEIIIKPKGKINIYYGNTIIVYDESDDIKVEYIKPKYSNKKVNYNNGSINVENRYDNESMSALRFQIEAANNKHIVRRIEPIIYIYVNKKNASQINIVY